MSSAAGGSGRPVGAPQSLTDGTAGRREQSVDPALLERVLRETAELWQDDSLSVDGDLAALQDVARRHRSEPRLTASIAGQLVYAVVRPRFQGANDPPAFWEDVSAQVAEKLLDDPAAHERLQSLWARLAESVS